MKNQDFMQEQNETTLKDYINLIRQNLLPITVITLAAVGIAIFYALTATNIYTSTTSMKLNKPSGNILEAPLLPEFQDFGSDRFIANEIEILKSYTTRYQVAQSLIDSFRISDHPEDFHLIYDQEKFFDNNERRELKSLNSLAGMFSSAAGVVTIEQKRGLDIVEISVESPSPKEAALIANIYADSYLNLNLNYNRKQLVVVKEFLEEQRKGKLDELLFAEEQLKTYQEERGVVDITQQARALIDQLTTFESQRNSTRIDMTISKKSLDQYKNELEKQDPRIKDYLESFAAEPYIKSLQTQIAQLQSQRDLALSNIEQGSISNSPVTREYDKKIEDLKNKLNDQIQVYKAGIFASNPEQIQELTAKVLEEEVRYQSLYSSYNELDELVQRYETRFNEMPKRTLDLARLQRIKEANEKLYLLVEEKYQEAQINEQSTPGNVLIVDDARVADQPSKPNRVLIIAVGLVLGLGLGFGFAFIKNYFDNTVKTPEELQQKNISLLAWIPEMFIADKQKASGSEFIVNKKSDSTASEAYRALRTRIRYSGTEGNLPKKLLVTSSSAGEGKTTTAVNLAGSFAQANLKVLLLDCDLRKPRVHKVFGDERYPGFIDYFFGQATFDELIRKTEQANLYYITGGTIPPNPAEILGSHKMEEFLAKLETQFDLIIIDSPPIIAVTDSEILAQSVDGVALVIAAGITEYDILYKSLDVLKMAKAQFLGTILNRFAYRPGYGSYYKYYYYYYNTTGNGKEDRKKSSNTKLRPMFRCS